MNEVQPVILMIFGGAFGIALVVRAVYIRLGGKTADDATDYDNRQTYAPPVEEQIDRYTKRVWAMSDREIHPDNVAGHTVYCRSTGKKDASGRKEYIVEAKK